MPTPSDTSLVNFLQDSRLVSAATARQIAEVFEPRTIAKGAYFLEERKVNNEYLFLEQGIMRAYVHDIEGTDVTTGLYVSNQVVFEVSSFFNRIPSTENIYAVTDCTGWVITYEQLNGLFHSLEEFREFGRHILVKGYTAYKTRMLSHIVNSAEERYAFLLQSHPEIFQHVPLKHIASYLGVTDTSLSRIRREYFKK